MTTAAASKATRRPKLNLTELAAQGFYFCNGCQRVSSPDLDAPAPGKCFLCGAYRLKFCPAVY